MNIMNIYYAYYIIRYRLIAYGQYRNIVPAAVIIS